MAYIYRHIRLDTNQPFYIGIGSDKSFKRAYDKKRPNPYWNNIVNNTEYEVEILLDELSWEEACKKEIEFISLYGRKNNNTGILSNMTDGGEGTKGRKVSDEYRQKLSLRNIGNNYVANRKNYIVTDETKNKISISNSGINNANYGKKKSKEEINKSILSKNCQSFYVLENGNIIDKFLSQTECAKKYNVQRTAINQCLKGKRNKAGNYTFIYESNIVTRK